MLRLPSTGAFRKFGFFPSQFGQSARILIHERRDLTMAHDPDEYRMRLDTTIEGLAGRQWADVYAILDMALSPLVRFSSSVPTRPRLAPAPLSSPAFTSLFEVPLLISEKNTTDKFSIFGIPTGAPTHVGRWRDGQHGLLRNDHAWPGPGVISRPAFSSLNFPRLCRAFVIFSTLKHQNACFNISTSARRWSATIGSATSATFSLPPQPLVCAGVARALTPLPSR